MLNRAHVSRVAGVVYTHWHPDHTAGWRILEQLNAGADVGSISTTPVYVPRRVWNDFEGREQLGMAANLRYLAHYDWARIELLEDECPIMIGDVRLEAIPMRGARGNMYAFLLEHGITRTLLAPDHLLGWQPPARLAHADVVVLEAGWLEHQPDGSPTCFIKELATTKTTFEETLKLVRELKPKRTFLTHIQHYYGWTYDDYVALQKELADTHPNLIFAHDGLAIDLI